MTKADILYLIHEKIDLKRREGKYSFKKKITLKIINIVVDVLFEIITDCITKGNRIELRGFGTFERKIRKPKIGINPKTKQRINLKNRAVPVFRPGRDLKTSVKKFFEENKI